MSDRQKALEELIERLDVSNRTGKEKVDGLSKNTVKRAIEVIKEAMEEEA